MSTPDTSRSGGSATTEALARGSGPRELPAVEYVDAAPRVLHLPAPAPVARPVPTLVTYDPPGLRVEHFPAAPPAAQSSRPSVRSPSSRARPELEAPPSPSDPADVALADVATATLQAVRERAGRSIFNSNTARERAPYDECASVPVLVLDPTPVRFAAAPLAVPRESTRSRRSVFDVPSMTVDINKKEPI